MKKTVLLALCIGLYSFAAGNTDSLKRILAKQPASDTVTARILCELADGLIRSDTTEAIRHINRAIRIGEHQKSRPVLIRAYLSQGRLYSLNYQDSLAIIAYGKGIKLAELQKDYITAGKLSFNSGISYNYTGDPDAALQAFSGAIRNFEKTDQKDLLARAYYFKGLVFSGKSLPDSAIWYYNLGADIYKKTGDKSLTDIINSTGIEYLNLAEYSKALEQFLKAYDLYQQDNNLSGTVNALNNIGIVHKNIGNYAIALNYYKQALDKNRELKDEVSYANALGNMGVIHDLLQQRNEALEYFHTALKIGEKLEDLTIITNNLNNAGIVYYEMGDYPSAMSYLERSAKILEKLQNQKTIGETYSHIGLIYLKADDSLLKQWQIAPKNRFAKALEYELKALERTKTTDNPKNMSFIWNNIYEIYLAQDRYKEALDAYKTYVMYQDSIALSDKKVEITRLETRYEYQKKELELTARHEAEIAGEKLMRKYTVFALMILFAASSLSFFFYKRNRDITEKQKTAEMNAHIAETEMRALRAQMNPHFIFNALNSISKYITSNDAESADFYLSKFARLMRSVLENSEHQLIRLKDDLYTLQLYMDLEAERLNHKFSYEIQIEPNIDPDKVLVPPLIFQPFIENSIWHGISRLKNRTGAIRISLFKEDQLLHCIIEDNGAGDNSIAETISTIKQKSLGTRITASRIRIMNKYGLAVPGSQFNYTEKGAVVDVYLPYVTEESIQI